jgi:hypothetical protein
VTGYGGHAEYQQRRGDPPEQQRPQPGFGRGLVDQNEVQPERQSEPTVSQATFVVNRCGLVSSSVASWLTNTTAINASPTPTAASCPGRSPQHDPRGDRYRRG